MDCWQDHPRLGKCLENISEKGRHSEFVWTNEAEWLERKKTLKNAWCTLFVSGISRTFTFCIQSCYLQSCSELPSSMAFWLQSHSLSSLCYLIWVWSWSERSVFYTLRQSAPFSIFSAIVFAANSTSVASLKTLEGIQCGGISQNQKKTATRETCSLEQGPICSYLVDFGLNKKSGHHHVPFLTGTDDNTD